MPDQIIGDGYTRAEMLAFETIDGWCRCQDHQVVPTDDWVGVHAQLAAEQIEARGGFDA